MEGDRIARRSVLVWFAAPLAAAQFWEKKEFERWADDEVVRVLADSPWSKPLRLQLELGEPQPSSVTWEEMGIPGRGPNADVLDPETGGSPVGGIGAPRSGVSEQALLTIRWAGALPVRQALARHRYGEEAAQSPEGKELLEREERFYVVEMLGVPSLIAYQGAQAIQDEVYRTAVLITGSGRRIPPESAYVLLAGTSLLITLRFPKTPPLTTEDKSVVVLTTAGPLEIRKEFKLKPMVYRGRLEL